MKYLRESRHARLHCLLTLGCALTFTGLAQAQETPWGEVFSFDRIKVAGPVAEPSPTPPEPVELDLTYSILRPTLVELPAARVEDPPTVELNVFDGDADLYALFGGEWQQFSGTLDLGELSQPIVAVIPHSDVLTLSVSYAQATSCELTWSCTSVVEVSWGLFRNCYYTCTFVSDSPVGCSGRTPNKDVKIIDVTTWRSACIPTPTNLTESY